MVEYGRFAVWTYFGIFALALLGFASAIQLGFHGATTASKAGVWGAAYLATKLTQPLRIAATLVLTPLVAKLARPKSNLS
jgi:glycine cleavage system protein P-like pyridoxal-binding family